MNRRKSQRPRLLREIGERGWIERLGRSMGRRARRVLVGLGDDAACLALPAESGNPLLFTNDLLVEGTHFTWQTATPATLGEKAVAVNVSDVAAMGGRPTAMIVGLGAPPDFPVARLEAVFRAIEKACRRWGVAFVGGDTVRSERFILAPALIGEFDGPAERLPLRSRLRAGQYLYVTGTLGDSAAGLLLLLAEKNARERSLPQPHRRHLIRRHQRPQPRLAEGQLLAAEFDDLAMIDLSDDLRTSIGLLSRASRVGVSIWLDRLPISPALGRFARLSGRDAHEMAVCGGEDYELLFATAAEPRAVRRLFRRAGIATPVRAIGCVGGKEVLWLDKTQRPVALSCRAFEHFAGDSHGT